MNHQKRHRLKDLNWNAITEAFLIVIGAAAGALVIAFLFSSCQKESSFTFDRPVIEDDHHLMPREGWNEGKRTETSDLQEASRRGGIKGKPPKDPTTPDEPNNPPVSAQNVLYLDLDGETVVNAYWNGGAPLTVRYSGMNAVEVDSLIAKVSREYEWQGFTVTTDRTVYDAAPTGHKHQHIVTESWEWYGRVGGVAYIGSYGWANPTPSFTFSSLLGYGGHNVAAAAVHEIGHALKLRHIPEPDGSSAYCTYGNWMGVTYHFPRGFFELNVKDNTGNYVNQFNVITSNL